ncbi:MAG TPA: phosphate regulon sensor histidine kinase PhoR, partial [Burkholderiaceae bacterium]|nr:phosphate regulon sensor histidine kinase PhoR [Burkholderiaceae bacterium]
MTTRTRDRIRVLTPAFVRVAALVALAVAVGWIFGRTAGLWVAVVGLGILLATHLFYASLLAGWLEHPRLEDIPNGVGIWTQVFARLYRARRTTEQNERRLQDNEERFRRTISALPEGIVLVDLSLQIEWCNPVAEHHLGVSLTGDHGMRVTNLVRDPAFVSFMTSGQYDAPLEFRPMARPNMALEVRVIEVERTRLMVISRDITQREQVDAMRRDFIANVSHELRTPLTVVNGFMEMLLDAQHEDPSTRHHHLKLMQEQAQRMSRLVEDLLTLSRLESSESSLVEEVVDVQLLMREVADEARALSGGRHRVELKPVRAFLRGNREELRSAFGNLVSNAIRYTPEGGAITLCWRADPDGGGRFEVRDTGIGVAPEHIARLTERFYRVDKSRSRETGGTGLGLAIVKHVLLRHDAWLDVQSEVGKGSAFAAVFPASRIGASL